MDRERVAYLADVVCKFGKSSINEFSLCRGDRSERVNFHNAFRLVMMLKV
jgi:hypothetical protein